MKEKRIREKNLLFCSANGENVEVQALGEVPHRVEVERLSTV